MTQVTIEQVIKRPKQEVWKSVAAFADTAIANPYVFKSYPVNDKSTGYGAIRHCELNADGSQYSEEEITLWNDGKSYQVRMIGGTNPPPVDDLLIEMSVEAIDTQSATLRMSFDYKPRRGIIGELMNRLIIRRMLRQLGQNVLTGYKINIETGNRVRSLDAVGNFATQTAQ